MSAHCANKREYSMLTVQFDRQPGGSTVNALSLGLTSLIIAALLLLAGPAAAQNKFTRPNGGQEVPFGKPTPGGSSGVSGGIGVDFGYEPAPPTPLRGAGSGFYVNSNHLVTNAHVVEPCRALRDVDGRELSLVQMDRELDLALLRADSPVDSWLAIAAPDPAPLGASVFVLGFPLYGELGNSVVVTTGVVSTRSGFLGRRADFGLNALIQPGNSGGPVLDSQGRVIGVAVARLAQNSGPVDAAPFNFGFAVSAEALTAFLNHTGADFDVAAEPVADMRDGVPARIEQTVRAVLCD